MWTAFILRSQLPVCDFISPLNSALRAVPPWVERAGRVCHDSAARKVTTVLPRRCRRHVELSAEKLQTARPHPRVSTKLRGGALSAPDVARRRDAQRR